MVLRVTRGFVPFGIQVVYGKYTSLALHNPGGAHTASVLSLCALIKTLPSLRAVCEEFNNVCHLANAEIVGQVKGAFEGIGNLGQKPWFPPFPFAYLLFHLLCCYAGIIYEPACRIV